MSFLPVLILLFFSGCRQMGALLPSTVTYRVSAFIDGSSVEDCGIARTGSEIQPYFVNSVADDPDIAGLLLYLQTSGGVPVGERVRYALKETGDQAVTGAAALTTGIGAPQAVSPADTAFFPETVVYVSRFEGRLPAMILPEDLEIGRYTLVFRVLGLHETLHRTEKPVFFLGDADFALEELHYYRPEGEDSSIIPPNVTVLLEAQVSADPRLEPWLVWYNGKGKVSEMPVSGRFSRLLWKTPEQTGFQTLRAEFFPYDPRDGEQGPNGYVKELSLPVSIRYGKAEETGEEGPLTLARYRLEGNLADSLSPEQEMKAEGDGEDLWLPWNRLYGLALGSERGYTLTLPPVPAGKSDKTLRFLISLVPLRDGRIFHAVLPLDGDPGPEKIELDFAYAEGAIILNWSAGPDTGSARLSTGITDEAAGLVKAALDLTPDADGLGIALSLPGEEAPEAGEIPHIPGRLGKQGSLRMGGDTLAAAPVSATALVPAVTFVPADLEGDAGPGEAALSGPEPPLAASFEAEAPLMAEEPEASGPVFILDEFSLILLP
jgi:hypothetical protein